MRTFTIVEKANPNTEFTLINTEIILIKYTGASRLHIYLRNEFVLTVIPRYDAVREKPEQLRTVKTCVDDFYREIQCFLNNQATNSVYKLDYFVDMTLYKNNESISSYI